ncbi:aldose 1-epimerase [Aquipluma nitroreducens]|uniref:Aldose 1-epimerase n=1 Tax=Aquipluma nitroreducens TaxID=2010828 RepID=A0A5K7SEF9_9BACT|nr:aldose epimerase family protein [Aquipluma nitroreducens]BBE19958.1 aldose 1-epimerase [Aquipluma nitroreducens]
MKITKSLFGKTNEEIEVDLFTLSNDNQVTVKITNYGAIITSIVTPDKNGELANIACGFEKLENYLSPEYLGSYPYFGCVCGRCCNRIAGGKFTLEGKNYALAVNNGANHLHGGLVGYDRRLWTAETIENTDSVGVKLSLLSPHLEEGYPGNVKISCTYTLNNNNELTIEYGAETDQTTIVNLTNHTYFNLTGGKDQILNHELELPAKTFTLNIDSIPTGEILPVAGTPNDFLTKKKISKDIATEETGYDLNFVLDNPDGKLVYAGRLSEATSGREVEVYTTQPGIQLYTGYWIPELTIDGQKRFGSYSGLALETQHYPDAINKPLFPPVTLAPGQNFYEKTIYKFGAK